MGKQPDFSVKPVIRGKKITLRPFAATDYLTMIEILNEPSVKRLTGSVTTSQAAEQKLDEAEEAEVYTWYQTRNQQTDRLDLAIWRKDGVLVGEVVLNDWEQSINGCNFRILIGASGQNKGFGTEATSLLVQYAFEELGLNRLELEVLAVNPRARKVYQKAGFVYEGTARQSSLFDDELSDVELYAILASDYFKPE